MKKILSFTAMLILVGTGCSSTSIGSTSGSGSPWDGTWVMTSEVTQSPAGEIVNPASNKLLIIDGDELIENYSSLLGLGDCTSTGEILHSLSTTDDSATTTYVSQATDPYIDCRGVAGTNAVPRSFKEVSWSLVIDGDTLTASATYGPSTVVQSYVR